MFPFISCFDCQSPSGWDPSIGVQLLAPWRKRGKAEVYMDELMNILNPALSSTIRPKIRCRDMATELQAAIKAGVRPSNEALFILNLLAYEILHVGTR